MRKLAWFAVVVLALSLCSFAADAPKAEIFGGYSYLRVGTGGADAGSVNTNGWGAAVTGNFNRYLGITADFSGQYASDLFGSNANGRLYNFLFGPKLTLRNSSKLTPFAHALFGVSHASADGEPSDNSFAMAFGGGLDAKVLPVVSIRLAQLDWVQTRFADDTQNHFRYSAGVVFNFK